MRKKFSFMGILSPFFLFLISFLASSVALAAIFPVNSTADEVDVNLGDGHCRTSSGTCTLRAAIQEANASSGSDTFNISVPAGTYTLTISGRGENSSATGDLDINGSITITGAGADSTIIDAAGWDERVVEVRGSSSTVTISNIKITGGNLPSGYDGGGGIYLSNSTATLTLSGVTISGNSAAYDDGGGIYSSGLLTISNSTISENNASDEGGGIYATNTLTLSNSVVSGNNATGGGDYSYGGGISSSGPLTISNSTISDNITNCYGGGIYATNTLTISNSTVSGNSVADFGGGIYSTNTLIISNSTVSGNSAAHGGGIFSGNNTSTISNSTVSGNSADSDAGGIYYSTSTATINNTTITNNTASTTGGIRNYNSSLTVRNSIIAGNSSTDSGYPDCYGTLTSAGYNLIQDRNCTVEGDRTGNLSEGTDPQLNALADNGGSTYTHSLIVGSPAIDAGDPAGCGNGTTTFTYDQRGSGYARSRDGDGVLGGRCDMGAFEYQITCGDNIIAGTETCEDGNATSGDGCSSACILESASSICGDGIRISSEACDDGNTTNGDGCSSTCTTEACGNHVLDSGEECDDGNSSDNDTCSSACLNQSLFYLDADGDTYGNDDGVALYAPSVPSGYSVTNTDCNDADNSIYPTAVEIYGDAIDQNCDDVDSFCGDGVIQTENETCDQGSANSDTLADACRTNCVLDYCGDGVVDTGEGCDGGENCTSSCTLVTSSSVCGNHSIENAEQCDDGNTISDDGCSSTCISENDFVVNSTADEVDSNPGDGLCQSASGACTLRAAVQELEARNSTPCTTTATVSLPAGTYTLSLVGSSEDSSASGDLDICGNITINGAGADSTIIDATGLGDRVFDLSDSASIVIITHLKITGGFFEGNPGGGIKNSSTLTLEGVEISGNTGRYGGGIYAFGSLTISNSTLSDNSTDTHGGAIYSQGTVMISNSTISGNSASVAGGGIYTSNNTLALSNVTVFGNNASMGGGIYNDGSSVILRNSIVGGNVASTSFPDCGGIITSAGYNLIQDTSGCTVEGDTTGHLPSGTDPQLNSLTNNGGPTRTHALIAGSPAIDVGDPSGCGDGSTLFSTDQRGSGYSRSADGNGDTLVRCDIGAYEYQIISCGDGIVAGSEQCDGGTGCLSNCALDLSMIDSDNDGITDDQDAFPDDPNESVDNDGDGTGNNADTDDDNDGTPDTTDTDDDGDAISDENEDTDGDGITDGTDTDDDNDGITDDQDSSPLSADGTSADGTSADGTITGSGDGTGTTESTGTGTTPSASAGTKAKGGCSLQPETDAQPPFSTYGMNLGLMALFFFYSGMRIFMKSTNHL